eukprot:3842750-Pleurochrysis_carterae.AAC.1
MEQSLHHHVAPRRTTAHTARLRVHVECGVDLRVDGGLRLCEFGLAERLAVRKVESQLGLVDERAALLARHTKRVAQRAVEHVRRRV